MQVAFPSGVRVRSTLPRPEGLRRDPFVNIDGEPYGRPSLNGLWRIEMEVFAHTERSALALSSFITSMLAYATCLVPVAVFSAPNGADGRPLGDKRVQYPMVRSMAPQAPEFTFDHVGFAADPFDGFTLLAPAAHRDSYIDIEKPALSHLWPGHFITLGDRLHQVVNVTHIDDDEARIRVSVMPNIRGNHAAGTVVIVDQLRLRCMMETGDPIGASLDVVKPSRLTFIEAF